MNLLKQEIDYEITETSGGVWRRYLYEDGRLFAEYRSKTVVCGLPLLHFVRGRSPETGRRVTARGIIAIGRLAVGVLAIGQASAGVIAIGQASCGLLLGIGQATLGLLAIGQLAPAILFGLGQFTCGYVAIGQFAVGWHVLAQIGIGFETIDWRALGAIRLV